MIAVGNYEYILLLSEKWEVELINNSPLLPQLTTFPVCSHTKVLISTQMLVKARLDREVSFSGVIYLPFVIGTISVPPVQHFIIKCAKHFKSFSIWPNVFVANFIALYFGFSRICSLQLIRYIKNTVVTTSLSISFWKWGYKNFSKLVCNLQICL